MGKIVILRQLQLQRGKPHGRWIQDFTLIYGENNYTETAATTKGKTTW
jgi:hypothetical protein